MRALERVLAETPLEDASRAVEEGQCVDVATGEPVRWEGWPMVLPATARLRARTEGEAYEEACAWQRPTRWRWGGAPAVTPAVAVSRRRVDDAAAMVLAFAAALLEVHLVVGFAQRRLGLASGREAGDPDRDMARRRTFLALREVGAQSPRARAGGLGVESGRDDEELVAAEAEQRVVAPEGLAQRGGDTQEAGVAGDVAEAVVDVLEIVDVEEDHGGAGGSHALDLVAQATPVRQRGERVEVDELAQALLGYEQLPVEVLEVLRGRSLDHHEDRQRHEQLGAGVEERGVSAPGERAPRRPHRREQQRHVVEEEHALGEQGDPEPARARNRGRRSTHTAPEVRTTPTMRYVASWRNSRVGASRPRARLHAATAATIHCSRRSWTPPGRKWLRAPVTSRRA